MLQLSLQQLFGSGASQDTTSITISKADLASVGLTVSANNRAESLLCALALIALQQWEGTVTIPGGSPLLAPGGSPLTYKQSRELYEKLRLFQWERKLSQGRIRETIVAEIFLAPPPDFGTPLTPNQVNYGD